MHIAEITDQDMGALIELWHRCALTRPWNNPHEDIAHARRATDATIFVGRLADALISSVMVGFDGHRGWVYYLAVAPDLQGRGYGRSMMETAELWLRQRGVPKLQLLVREMNLSTIGFYERLGLERQPVLTFGKRLDEARPKTTVKTRTPS